MEMLTIKYNYTYKSWVAKLTGLDEKFGFKRTFIKPYETQRSSTGKTGTNTYDYDDMPDGFYEIVEVGEREYYNVTSGKFEKVEKRAVTTHFKKVQKNA